MTRYEHLKSISKAEYNKLKATGMLKSCCDFYIDVYDEFLIHVKTGVGIMQSYTNTSDTMCTSEATVRAIITNLSKSIVSE